MRKESGQLIFSPSDLVLFVASPFASWMDRYHLENPGVVVPDSGSSSEKLIAQTGREHERAVLEDFRSLVPDLVEIKAENFSAALADTGSAIRSGVGVVYQAALAHGKFAGFADFLIRDDSGYQVWDTKLAHSPKPYYIIQLCCYSEMLAGGTGGQMPSKFGIILGTGEDIEFRVQDFIHYYYHVKTKFLSMQGDFTGDVRDRPEPLSGADHGRWSTHAEQFLRDSDHLGQVAGITSGQIKKLKKFGISTMAELATASGRAVPKLATKSLERLIGQARLQCQTRSDRIKDPEASPRFAVLPHVGANGESVGLASLPRDHPADVFFDMEGYPLVAGGLEYLFGVCSRGEQPGSFEFKDWWAHDRGQEKLAFEGFIDWVFSRWQNHPGMHIYHYAAYEVSALRRLSTQHDTRQDEVDDLLRNEVFVDLYHIVSHGLQVGEDGYSIKKIERLYRSPRSTEIATAADSMVQYAHWLKSRQPQDWTASGLLRGIRDYNEDDCRSTAELSYWLRKVAAEHNIAALSATVVPVETEDKELPVQVAGRLELVASLRKEGDAEDIVLADVVDFHRREGKPRSWRRFDRAKAPPEELCNDNECIEGVWVDGRPVVEKRSLIQVYRFDSAQECKLAAGEKTRMMFSHNLDATLNLSALDLVEGTLQLKISNKALQDKFGGSFPLQGSLLHNEYISPAPIPDALNAVAAMQLARALPKSVIALLRRMAPGKISPKPNEAASDAAIRIASSMEGECLVIQGPPGTGKTYTAARVINALLATGKRVGIAANSHAVVVKLLEVCGEFARDSGRQLMGIKVGGLSQDSLCSSNPKMRHVEKNAEGHAEYTEGVVGGTAWLFTRPEWEDELDFLFIDEAGQVSLANAIAMARCAKNLVLLGDQMQLEQPIQGVHPGDSGLSVLQYALKDMSASRPDAPVFHPVVPSDRGLFLGESRRMHPSVCRFISDSIYEGRLESHPDCAKQRIALPTRVKRLIDQENGIVFSGIEHDGNTQSSLEEAERAKSIYSELVGLPYTAADGSTKPLELRDFLFVAPYNAQVRVLQAALPPSARVGSVDKFQGQEAPVCILSLCSSHREYGSRGMSFILDRNRINVAISRAQCLVVVVADPRIAGSLVGSIDEMGLLSLFCKLTGGPGGNDSA